ncbi:hypothetical protein CAEBREN_32630 [Caenorhabditis brenneri]|uniref:Uncharacterized protein n=1 Tax=Caenorhabditis brenneri TaxID=135651 RepID=G0N5B3_CAEBE|nr:hypothetical protein CAEBREN_32630 [Caenorhabditis brenneri]
MVLSFLFLTLTLATLSSATYNCKNEIVNLQNPNPYYYPATWNEQRPAPVLGANNSCSFTILVPQGHYAKLVMSTEVGDKNSSIRIIDAYNNLYDGSHEMKNPWYFPYNRFLIIVNNGAPAKFAFKVNWAQYPSGVQLSAAISKKPRVVSITKNVFTAQFHAVTGLSLLAFPEDLSYLYALRSTFVFEGDDFNGHYVDSLYNLYLAHKQWITKKNIYIVNVEARGALDQLLVQEAGYTQAIDPYQQMSCNPSSTCYRYLGTGNPASGLVYVGNQTQTLLDISIPWNSTLSVYYGTPTSSNLYKTYDGTSIRSMLPLKFSAEVVQYIVNGGVTTYNFKFS